MQTVSNLQITLGQMIEYLEKLDPKTGLSPGLNQPHSYRGYYDQLAFESCFSTTVETLLKQAKLCVNQQFIGYKGGIFLMDENTLVNVANYGNCGYALTYEYLERIICK